MIRTIKYVYDDDTGEEVPVSDLLDRPDKEVHDLRREIALRHRKETDRYYCPKCKGSVWPSVYGDCFFKHYSPADPSCEWYTGSPQDLLELNRTRFHGLPESPLHKRLVKFIHEMTSGDCRFQWSNKDKKQVIDLEQGLRRKPDVWAMFGKKECVFELQLSRTYLNDIVGREDFYMNRKIFMIWVFHGFDRFKEFAAAKDIYYANRSNALELDFTSERESQEAGVLKLRCHWLGFALDDTGNMQHGWQSKLVDLDDLTWDESTYRPYYVDPIEWEFSELRRLHADWLNTFEIAWLQYREDRYLWLERALPRLWERLRAILSHRPLPSLSEAKAYSFEDVLDRLFAITRGKVHFSRQNLIGSTDTLLEHRREFTDALIAVAKASNNLDAVLTESTRRKVHRNLGSALGFERYPQAHHFNPIIWLLFPGAGIHLRGTEEECLIVE